MKKALIAAVFLSVISGTPNAQAQTPTSTPTPLFCYSAQWGSAGSGSGQFDHLVGVAVDSDNNWVYVADWNNNRVQKFTTGGRWLATWTGFDEPNGVAVDSAGKICVINANSSLGNVLDSSGSFLVTFGSPGSGNGQFDSPKGIAVDSSGNVFVADTLNNRVEKFSLSGSYIAQWGGLGSGNGQMNDPVDVAVDGSGNVYATDLGNSRVEKFDSNGNYLGQWGSPGSGPGQFLYPAGVAVDPCGDVLVADENLNTIQFFDQNGNYKGMVGGAGSGNGQFQGVQRTAFDGAGNLYATDYILNRVQKFTPCGSPCAIPTPTLSYQGTNPPSPGQCFIYPSPARGSQATLAYNMAEAGQVELRIWNERAELAAHVTDSKPAGVQMTPFSIAGFGAGVYFYSVTFKYDSGQTKKLGPKKFAVVH